MQREHVAINCSYYFSEDSVPLETSDINQSRQDDPESGYESRAIDYKKNHDTNLNYDSSTNYTPENVSNSSNIPEPKTNNNTTTNYGYSPEDYFFNERFQSLMSNYDAVSSRSRDKKTVTLLSDCNSDFTYTVETFGKIIISEKNLPPEKKTIKPINVGGIAGGEKFIHRGILFKYAIDPVIAQKNGYPVFMYGGSQRNDELAMKAAGNELKGNSTVIDIHLEAIHRFVAACQHAKNLHTPLMSLCDYYGFRLIAMSLLPITDKTIIYGSSNAGQTVWDSNPKFRESIRTVAEVLNLKSHYVGQTLVYTAADVEGHLGTDGRLYALDFGRLYPPEAPGIVEDAGGCSSDTRCVFYKHLRPELVKMNPVPLCSDAYTAFQHDDPEKAKHNQEVKEATKRLVNQIIPKTAEELDSMETSRSNTMTSITEQIHRQGINLRHLGLLRSYTKTPGARVNLLTEMWVRSLKSVIYRILRLSSFEQRVLSSLQAKRIIAEIFSLIFHPSAFHQWYWQENSLKCSKDLAGRFSHFDYLEHIPSFKYSITEKYGPKALSNEESTIMINQQHVMLSAVLYRISQVSCFNVGQDLIDDFQHQKVTEVDIVSVEPRTKYTSLIHLCDGLSSLHKGKQLHITTERRPFLKMMMNAEMHLSRAWSLHPENETVVFNRGLVSLTIAKAILKPEWADVNVTAENITSAIVWLEQAADSFEDTLSMLQVEEKHLPKNGEKSESKSMNFGLMKIDSLAEGAYATMLSGIYETSLFKALNPQAIRKFEKAAKMLIQVHQSQRVMGRLIQDSFVEHAHVWPVGVISLCHLNSQFKDLLVKEVKDFQITEISMGSGILHSPQLISAPQIDTLIELLGNFAIKKVDLANCICLHEKSVVQILEHFGKTVTYLNLSGILVNENVMTSIGANLPELRTLVMRKCSLTDEVILTWAPKLWNRISKHTVQIPSGIEELDLEANPHLEDEAILALLKRLDSVKKVNLKSCRISESAIEKIKSNHSDLELLHTTGDLGISHPISVTNFN